MAYKTFLRFYHTISIYQRTITTSAAGQKVITYSLASTVPAVFQSNSSERRVAPYVDNIDEFQFYVSHQHSQYVDYNNRILNIYNRYNNLIEAGPLEITNIEKKMGWGGKLHHVFVTARKVVEDA